MPDNTVLSKLIFKISKGDKQALEDLWIELKDGVYSFILSLIHDRQLSEDALSETFISIYKSSGSFKPGTNARAWIYIIARNTSISVLRKQKEKTLEFDEVDEIPSPYDFEIISDHRDELERLLYTLDETSRRIVLLHAVSDLRHSDIAEILNLPLGTVYRRYSQGIKKLQSVYKMQIIEEV